MACREPLRGGVSRAHHVLREGDGREVRLRQDGVGGGEPELGGVREGTVPSQMTASAAVEFHGGDGAGGRRHRRAGSGRPRRGAADRRDGNGAAGRRAGTRPRPGEGDRRHARSVHAGARTHPGTPPPERARRDGRRRTRRDERDAMCVLASAALLLALAATARSLRASASTLVFRYGSWTRDSLARACMYNPRECSISTLTAPPRAWWRRVRADPS